MVVTPKTGFIVDPQNPNAVIADPNTQQPAAPVAPVAPTPAAPAAPTAPVAPAPTPAAPAAPVAPAAPPAAPVVPQPKAYTVQPNDTLAQIAIKFGVPITQISGYRSGDPNKIFPGETLTIGAPVAPAAAPVQQPGQPAAPAAPAAPADAPVLDENADVGDFNIDEIGIDAPQENDILSSYGIDSGKVASGFDQNPTKTVQDLLAQVMQATGLPDAKQGITEVAGEIEKLQNEADDAKEKIDNDPFLSAGTKQQRKDKIDEKYDRRILAKTNALKLIQDSYDSARQQSQFAVTTAINLFDRNRNFDQGQLEFAVTQAEKRLEAIRDFTKINPAVFKEVNGGLYNIESGEWLVPPSANVKPPTEAQQTLSTYALRVQQANPIIEKLQDGIVGMSPLIYETQLRLPSYAQSGQFQSYMQAARNFINSVLRRESGAVISPEEFKEARQQYLPVPGDSEETLTQKKNNRDLVQNSYISGAGTAYTNFGGSNGLTWESLEE